MNPERIRLWLCITALTVVLVLTSCASPSYLSVVYRVPAPSDRLHGQRVRIEIKDLRPDARIFTPAASRHFENFAGRYRLAWTNGKENVPVGTNDLQGLFREAFAKRLEQLGARIVPPDRDNAPLFQILIHDIRIDLQDRKWIAKIGYEADLVQDNQLIARESVSGTAERARIIGSKGAGKALSDIFTEIINRLNIVKLFQQAKMV